MQLASITPSSDQRAGRSSFAAWSTVALVVPALVLVLSRVKYVA